MDIQQRNQFFKLGEDVILEVILDVLREAHPGTLRTDQIADRLDLSPDYAMRQYLVRAFLYRLKGKRLVQEMPRTQGGRYRWRYAGG